MRILSTRGRYGLRLMFELALRAQEGCVPLSLIAESADLSEHYLEQLVAPLRRAGLVESQRGAQGGYQLSRPPSHITVGEVLSVLEGPLIPADCVDEDQDAPCEHRMKCAMHVLWSRLRDSMKDVLDHTTLADMLADDAELNEAADLPLGSCD